MQILLILSAYFGIVEDEFEDHDGNPLVTGNQLLYLV
jgi:hypothetical protein